MFKIASAIFVVSLLGFIGCGGGSSNTTGNNTNTAVVIDTEQKAKNTFVALDQMMNSMDVIDTASIKNAEAVNFSSRKNRILEEINQTTECVISGTASITGTTDSTQMNITTSFSQCKNTNDETIDGTIHAQGAENNLTIVFTNYSKTDLNGTKTVNLTAHMFKQSSTNTITREMDGTISNSTLSITFTDYVVIVDNTNNNVNINGTVSIAHTPASCADGTYVIETIQPLHEDPVTEEITSGQIKINNVLFTFQSNGNATATINGQEITIDTDNDEIVCN